MASSKSDATTSKEEGKKDAIPTRDIYLTPDERYAVWVVKAAERPHLLLNDTGSSSSSIAEEEPSQNERRRGQDEKKEEAEEDAMLPLQDGCDIPGWRAAGVVLTDCETTEKKCSNDNNNPNEFLRALLRVGPGCTLTRRESQLPLSQQSNSCWRTLQAKLLQPPIEQRQARRVHIRDLLLLFNQQQERPWFEREGVPCIIEGCCDNWKAMESCRFQRLVERFGAMEWRFSDTHGEGLTLRTYQKYCSSSLDGARTDDAPLAVYDSQFGNDLDGARRCIVEEEYAVPPCFQHDLFATTIDDEDERPPHRWILNGPERSGTGLHVDPVGTQAWVSLIEGCKRWVLFPPDVDRRAIGMPDDNDDDGPQIPSVLWFRDHYEQALRHCPGAIEVLQQPGETVYVPAGWPHLVLNVRGGNNNDDNSSNNMITAITQNYATEFPSLLHLYREIAHSEPALAVRFVAGLRERRPALYERLRLEHQEQQQKQHPQQ